MSSLKRFLLLLSIGVFLLAGLIVTSSTKVSSTAFASGCNTVATDSWSNNCTVSEGNISNFVYAIQTAINESIGNGCVTEIDGNFGSSTLTAVKCFQAAKGFPLNERDGVVGPMTWGALRGVLTFDHLNAGWDYYHSQGHSITDWRKFDNSGVWYVHVASLTTGQFKWCQINLSSPCNP